MESLRKAYLRVQNDHFPDEMTISLGDQKLVYQKRVWTITDPETAQSVTQGLRYGENPGQEAALFELMDGNLTLGDCKLIEPGNGLVSSLSEKNFHQFGKHPGKINLTDIDAAINILKYLTKEPAAVIIKHNNPCGAALGKTINEAYEKAYFADRLAAMGGCVALNGTVDQDLAEEINRQYFEVVAAPEYSTGAVEILKKRKNLRIVEIGALAALSKYASMRFLDFKSLQDGGIILQQSPINRVKSQSDLAIAATMKKGLEYKIERTPTEEEWKDMLFGWSVEQGVTSNSVLYIKNQCTVAVGTGEQDRVGVAKIARDKAYEKLADSLCFRQHGIPLFQLEIGITEGKYPPADLVEINETVQSENGGLLGSAMISDAFFPFRDGVDVGIKEGVSAICQPGGSLNDFESIQACNEANPKVTMVYTGQRAFKH
ncbi:MAG: IMP cyclohydrolase [Planctomycetota bacterium]|nr:IMP cyclohydrolase [Planctomycetota bacterium]MDA1138112.1 IMP cyclohydrolase [Planctomycetota bacterium]